LRRICAVLAVAAPFLACDGPAAEELGDTEDVEAALSEETGELPSLGADIKQTSVSGVSAGATMASQVHVAYSSIMRGAGLIAGTHYECADWSALTGMDCIAETSDSDRAERRATSYERADHYAEIGDIDPLANLRSQRLFLLTGDRDMTIDPGATDDIRRFYGHYMYGDETSLASTDLIQFARHVPGIGHTWPTLTEGVDCATTAAPFLGKCNYDAAGKILGHIYGPLQERANTLTGKLIKFKERPFASENVAEYAWAYVPTDCTRTQGCRTHVFFHGCSQGYDELKEKGLPENTVAVHSGLNEWAENNRIIVLYPQVWHSRMNPYGCWDWWGYTGNEYARNWGTQMLMVKKMLERLARG
jgi:poly(3-hydroxybutyrate) depolymerase